MPLNAIQQYVQGLVNEVESTYLDPTCAYIAPPVPGELTVPTLYVWGSAWDDKRQTAPRPLGYKKVTWALDIWIMYADLPDNPHADSAFPCLVDALTYVLNTTTMPTVITDPDTEFQSQVLSIGEKIHGDYAPVRGLGDDNQELLLYQARLQVHIEEKVQYFPGDPN